MDASKFEADIGYLLTQLERTQPEDRHQIHFQIREHLRQMRAFGMPLPEDLERLEARLEAEFAQSSKGPGRGEA